MSLAIVLDIAALVILLICAGIYARKGFFSSLLVFVGTLAALIFAVVLANKLSPAVFENFFQANLEQKTTQALGQTSVENLNELIRNILGFLPASVVDSVTENLGNTLDFTTADLAAQIVEEVIAPLVIPIISIIVFFVAFALLRVLISLLSAILSGVNKVPLLGTVNKALGAGVGVFIGALYVYLLLCIIWAIDASYGAGVLDARFGTSLVYSALQNWNIFAA